MKKHLSLILLTGLITVSCNGAQGDDNDPNIYNWGPSLTECLDCLKPLWANIVYKISQIEDHSEAPYDHPVTKKEWIEDQQKNKTQSVPQQILMINNKKSKQN